MIFEIDKKQVFASTAGKDFDPTKKTVFLLHGSGLSHIVWSLTEQFLSNKDLNILSLDLPGHGNSDGPCIDSIEKIADWIESVRLFSKTQLDSLRAPHSSRRRPRRTDQTRWPWSKPTRSGKARW